MKVYRVGKAKVYVYKEHASLVLEVVRNFGEAMSLPQPVFGLAKGNTPIPIYQEMVRQFAGDARLKKLQTFNLDEYYPVSADHRGSFYQYMLHHLFTPLGLTASQVHLLNGQAPDPLLEAKHYEDQIQEAHGIDVQLLGLGRNGHIGFNEPGASFAGRTQLVTLTQSTREANAVDFPGEFPRQALTMGIGTILEARRLLMVATGAEKREAVLASLLGPKTEEVPGSALRDHDDVLWFLDEESSSELLKKL